MINEHAPYEEPVPFHVYMSAMATIDKLTTALEASQQEVKELKAILETIEKRNCTRYDRQRK